MKWIVIKAPIQMSAAQIKAFGGIITKNNRPVQPLHGRTVYADVVKSVKN